MTGLEDYAKKVAKDFSKDYRTIRNPRGKECIVVYGGRLELREKFSRLVRTVLPTKVDAYVFEQKTKRGFRERGDDLKVFYIDLSRCSLSC